ncbi:glycogenin glucosyltransferase [Recurvomyces mirabilis]|uniref:glycogenin glucosyltransferase n=1 Tax=Recurvomyces mirabilis TaxID=574656 RepID=A0AAE0WIF5_9PEZI|nr:glycogenin glucosyltransferase [Recurvomyces mirabilis]KAK5150568.1 glycogenin glucosyltransferase [Recurvomyces mirabilis]
MAVGEGVYCTLVMTDAYLPGAAVLAHSLRDAGTTHKLACLITQDSLRPSTISELQSLYNYVIPIERIGNPSPANLYLMNRPDLLYTFTKINLWRLTQFRKIVYVDADVVALRAPDELFALPDDFAAAPDVGWPDIFNTGVMALTPRKGDYWALRGIAKAGDSFDGADQGLLNQYYEHKRWKRLSFTYNCTPSANYQYEPAYRYYKSDISMVHFIGSEKPWQRERGNGKGTPGVFQELLSRWWAVYDRHFKVSAYEYISTGRREPAQHDAVRDQVRKETEPAYYATGYPVQSADLSSTSEMPFTEPQPKAEAIDQGNVHPTPTSEQRRFSAPHAEWDATRRAPPTQSKPEAANFPSQVYEFSSDTQPFRPPAAYPEPPKDMWYQVPTGKSKPLPAIFPWEERNDAAPTRVWGDEEKPAEPEEEEDDFKGGDELAVTNDDEDLDFTPTTPTIKVDDAPWTGFGGVNKNAWDEVNGIDDYVRALTRFQKTRGKVQVLSPSQDDTSAITSPPAKPGAGIPGQQSILSPSNEPEPTRLIQQVRERRESLLLTDFPSAVERPSLPVTPAPRRRPTFWGIERDGQGELPGAEGVVEQGDWDPDHQLEELRRNSLIGPSDLKLPKKNLPQRQMPGSATETIPEEIAPTAMSAPTMTSHHSLRSGSGDHPATSTLLLSAAEKNAAKAAPTFSEPAFDAAATRGSGLAVQDAVLSPTERMDEGEGIAP